MSTALPVCMSECLCLRALLPSRFRILLRLWLGCVDLLVSLPNGVSHFGGPRVGVGLFLLSQVFSHFGLFAFAALVLRTLICLRWLAALVAGVVAF